MTENQQAGTSAWRIGYQISGDASGQIKGYASATSVLQNQPIALYVTVNPAQTYTIDFYRIGYYGGLGGRLRRHAGPLNGIRQPACPVDQTTGMIACNWSASYTLTIPGDWTSGVYVALLTNAAGYQSYVIFVVKDGRPAAFLYQQSVTTYQAYNNYPNDSATGKSLYDYNSNGAVTSAVAPTCSTCRRAVKVSFDRPYTWEGAGQFFNWEVDFIRWLEKAGYDVSYSTDVDTHANGAALLNSKAFLSVGHDEYWSGPMFDAAQAARDKGVNLGFFGADAASWQIRFEPSSTGIANRVEVCYKDATIDPVQGPTTTVNFRSAPVNRPEQTLEGIQSTSGVNWGNNVDYGVSNSSQWAYGGTGFTDSSTARGIVGYEMDRYMSNYPAPPAISRTLLAQTPFTDWNGRADYQNTSIYQGPSGAWVFAAGTISWSQALDNFDSVFYGSTVDVRNAGIQTMTANVLNAFLNGAPVVSSLRVSAPTSMVSGQAFTTTVTAVNWPQGNTVSGYAGTVHFSSSDSQALLPADYTFTAADNGAHQFLVTLNTQGNQTITATDTVTSSISGNRLLTITPGV